VEKRGRGYDPQQAWSPRGRGSKKGRRKGLKLSTHQVVVMNTNEENRGLKFILLFSLGE
jgi:hypothetical protein